MGKMSRPTSGSHAVGDIYAYCMPPEEELVEAALINASITEDDPSYLIARVVAKGMIRVMNKIYSDSGPSAEYGRPLYVTNLDESGNVIGFDYQPLMVQELAGITGGAEAIQ